MCLWWYIVCIFIYLFLRVRVDVCIYLFKKKCAAFKDEKFYDLVLARVVFLDFRQSPLSFLPRSTPPPPIGVVVWLRPQPPNLAFTVKKVAEKPSGEHLKMYVYMYVCMYVCISGWITGHPSSSFVMMASKERGIL